MKNIVIIILIAVSLILGMDKVFNTKSLNLNIE